MVFYGKDDVMKKVYDYETLRQDIKNLKEQFSDKENSFIIRQLKRKGWTLRRYKNIFPELQDLLNFFQENGIKC
jgi:DNA-binding winged helix-turn-helix (wHTH) protein